MKPSFCNSFPTLLGQITLPGIDFLVRTITQLIVILFLAACLPPAKFGQFSFIVTLVTIAGLFASGGFDGLLMTYVNSPLRFARMSHHLLVLKLTIYTIATLVIMLTTISHFDPDEQITWILLALSASPTYYFEQKDITLRAHGEFTQYRFRAITGLISATLRCSAILLSLPLSSIAAITLGEAFTILAYYNIKHNRPRTTSPRHRIKSQYYRKNARTLIILWISNALTALFFRLDHLIVQHYLGFQHYAFYVFSYRFFENCLNLTAFFLRTTLPGYYAGSIPAKHLWRNCFMTGNLCATAALVLMYILIQTHYHAYMPSIEIFLIGIISLNACIFGMLRGSLYLQNRLSHYDLFNACAGIVVLTTVSPLLQIHYALTGAALAFMIACLISSIISTYFNKAGYKLLHATFSTRQNEVSQ